MGKCSDCVNWKHDPANSADRDMANLHYKPCKLDSTIGRYLSGQAKACENFKAEKMPELPF